MCHKLFLPFILFIFALFLVNPQVFAQSESSSITVYPSIVRLDLSSDKPEIILNYKNSTKSTVELSFSAQDFTDLEEGWKVKYLEDKDVQNFQYGLSSWISFEKNSLVVSPNEIGKIKIFIDGKRLSPGGHYASILAEIKGEKGKGQVGLRGILSSLLFVRTSTGQEIETGSIGAFLPTQSGISFPEKFLLRFNNSGNVELIPYGVVEVKDPLGRVIAKGILNEGSLITLPQTLRRYDIDLNILNRFYPPGIYTANLSLHFGKNKEAIDMSVKFFSQGSVNLWIYGFIIIIISVIIIKLMKRKKARG